MLFFNIKTNYEFILNPLILCLFVFWFIWLHFRKLSFLIRLHIIPKLCDAVDSGVLAAMPLAFFHSLYLSLDLFPLGNITNIFWEMVWIPTSFKIFSLKKKTTTSHRFGKTCVCVCVCVCVWVGGGGGCFVFGLHFHKLFNKQTKQINAFRISHGDGNDYNYCNENDNHLH